MSTPLQKQARREGKGKDKGKAEVSDDPSMENDGERPAAGSSPGKKSSKKSHGGIRDKKWTDEEDNVLIRILLDDPEVCNLFIIQFVLIYS